MTFDAMRYLSNNSRLSVGIALATWATLATVGCKTPAVDSTASESGPTKTLTLATNESGDLVYCDLDSDGDGIADANCRTFPNPNNCALLTIEIDTATGGTCETCADAEGATLTQSCDGTTVACTLVTAPDPDCVVCAHIGGSVIYSSCVSAQPYCEVIDLAAGDGVTPPATSVECRICYDDAGRVIIDECGEDCSNVRCAPDCGADSEEVLYPGDCCPVCVPRVDCTDVFCTFAGLVPDCPAGTELVRDPADCCSYRCEATDCSTIACPPVTIACQNGYHADYSFPHCCGTCVPDEGQPRYCLADGDCLPDELCSAGIDCLPPPDCDPNGGFNCAAVCYGFCRPIDHVCDSPPGGGGSNPIGSYCEGVWESGGRDEFGCALPPICICFDGTTSFDGICGDQCASVDCFTLPPACDAGATLTMEYPDCCGACLPDDVCANTDCTQVLCAVGTHLEPDPLDPSNCCGVCFPDLTGCYSSQDCSPTEVCSVDLGDCGLPPGCDGSGSGCPTVCYGECWPRYICAANTDCLWGEACENGVCVGQPACITSYDCPIGNSCTTETNGDCLSLTPPAGCDPATGCLGPPVCYGVCETSGDAPASQCGTDNDCPSNHDCLIETWCPDCVFQTPPCSMPCESFGICVAREEPCGNAICTGGLVCCNSLLSICTEPGMVCIQ